MAMMTGQGIVLYLGVTPLCWNLCGEAMRSRQINIVDALDYALDLMVPSRELITS